MVRTAKSAPYLGNVGFNEVFKASEIVERDWIEDMYILSVQPLTMEEEILENGEWISLTPNASENTPEP